MANAPTEGELEAELAEHIAMVDRARDICAQLQRDLHYLEEMAKGRACNVAKKLGEPVTAERVQAVIDAASEATPAPDVDPYLRAILGASSLTARELDGFVQILTRMREALHTGETPVFLNPAEPMFDGRLVRPLFEATMRMLLPLIQGGAEVSIVVHRVQDDGSLSATFSTTLVDRNPLAKVLEVLSKRLTDGLEPVRARGPVGKA